jgi:hypothetical protein
VAIVIYTDGRAILVYRRLLIVVLPALLATFAVFEAIASGKAKEV